MPFLPIDLWIPCKVFLYNSKFFNRGIVKIDFVKRPMDNADRLIACNLIKELSG